MKLVTTCIALLASALGTLAVAAEQTLPASSPSARPAAAQKSLTLLITGDNRGEIAPCG